MASHRPRERACALLPQRLSCSKAHCQPHTKDTQAPTHHLCSWVGKKVRADAHCPKLPYPILKPCHFPNCCCLHPRRLGVTVLAKCLSGFSGTGTQPAWPSCPHRPLVIEPFCMGGVAHVLSAWREPWGGGVSLAPFPDLVRSAVIHPPSTPPRLTAANYPRQKGRTGMGRSVGAKAGTLGATGLSAFASLGLCSPAVRQAVGASWREVGSLQMPPTNHPATPPGAVGPPWSSWAAGVRACSCFVR